MAIFEITVAHTVNQQLYNCKLRRKKQLKKRKSLSKNHKPIRMLQTRSFSSLVLSTSDNEEKEGQEQLRYTELPLWYDCPTCSSSWLRRLLSVRSNPHLCSLYFVWIVFSFIYSIDVLIILATATFTRLVHTLYKQFIHLS